MRVNHDPAKWDEFRQRYWQELEAQENPVAHLLALARDGRLTLIFGAKDREYNNAVALKEYLKKCLGTEQ